MGNYSCRSVVQKMFDCKKCREKFNLDVATVIDYRHGIMCSFDKKEINNCNNSAVIGICYVSNDGYELLETVSKADILSENYREYLATNSTVNKYVSKVNLETEYVYKFR